MAQSNERKRFRLALAFFMAWVAALGVTAMLSAYRPAPRASRVATPDLPADATPEEPTAKPGPG